MTTFRPITSLRLVSFFYTVTFRACSSGPTKTPSWTTCGLPRGLANVAFLFITLPSKCPHSSRCCSKYRVSLSFSILGPEIENGFTKARNILHENHSQMLFWWRKKNAIFLFLIKKKKKNASLISPQLVCTLYIGRICSYIYIYYIYIYIFIENICLGFWKNMMV